jgi:hypothetical protein
MKVGDLIYDSHFKEYGIVVDSKPMHNQHGSWCTILYEDGQIAEAKQKTDVINAGSVDWFEVVNASG